LNVARSKLRILIVDDEVETADATAKLAIDAGYEVLVARDGRAALELAQDELPDAVITDLRMPGVDGQDLLVALKRLDPELPVLMVTGYGEIPWAVEAMLAGAVDFVSKPTDWASLEERLRGALRTRALRGDRGPAAERLRELLGMGLGPLIGASPAMAPVFDMARRAAPSRASVLITGETGTGKGELARCIHALGPRRDHPFVVLHCAALTETLIESELFGHEMGAFTGATNSRAGRFEQADGGTLFIDEVAEIPLRVQTKLLRVLQDRKLSRVGGTVELAVDIRLIAATNADLVERVDKGRFRKDLFYRLDVLRIEMPPLRDRTDDIMLLAQPFLFELAASSGKEIVGFSDAARTELVTYDWPGNVRELRNAIEYAVVMCTSRVVGVEDLPPSGKHSEDIDIPGATLRDITLDAVRTTFLATGRDTRRTAEMLHMPERTLQYRLRELGLSRPRGRPPKSSRPESPLARTGALGSSDALEESD